MPANPDAYKKIRRELDPLNIQLLAVSKTKSPSDILELYDLGHRDFAENYVQELTEKQAQLPEDIRWHFIGHLQSNKVKYLAPFVHLIHSVDSEKLLLEINKQGAKHERIINVLLQLHIAHEETKFGFDEKELEAIVTRLETKVEFPNVSVCGMMGLASFTEDNDLIRSEFTHLKSVYETSRVRLGVNAENGILSMGMSADYMIAAAAGSTMVRIGSLLFGARG